MRRLARWNAPAIQSSALRVTDKEALGQEFFRWEVAVAVAAPSWG